MKVHFSENIPVIFSMRDPQNTLFFKEYLTKLQLFVKFYNPKTKITFSSFSQPQIRQAQCIAPREGSLKNELKFENYN